jgi:hypothetical protein
VLGNIPLDNAAVTKVEEHFNKQYCFEIVVPNRTFYLCAETRIEMEEWMRDLRHAITTPLPKTESTWQFEDQEVTLSFITSGTPHQHTIGAILYFICFYSQHLDVYFGTIQILLEFNLFYVFFLEKNSRFSN